MKKTILVLITLFLSTGLLYGQKRGRDNSTFYPTRPFYIGTTAPATCAVGDTFFDSDATAGQNLYGCTATNTWTLQGAAGTFGETSLAGLVNSQTLWDGANASRTLTFSLSGATDPVLTFSNNLVSLNTIFEAAGIRTTAGSEAGLHEFNQGTACTPAANTVCVYGAASIGTAYGIALPSTVGASGVAQVSVSGAVATLSFGTATVAQGGTGAVTLTGLLQGNGTSAVTAITNSTTVGQTLRVTGSNTYGWGALDLADTDAVTGLLPDANIASTITRTVASGTKALDTDLIATTACDTLATTTATGVASTDTIIITPNADITGVTGYTAATTGGLQIFFWPTTNTINWKVCNPTSASITPGAVTLNYRVVR